MNDVEVGDLVRIRGTNFEMLVLGGADDDLGGIDEVLSVFCAWEDGNLLRQEIFLAERLVLVRKERRRIPRGGRLTFPRTLAKNR